MSNSCTLLVRPRKGHPKVNQGHLIVKKSQIPITTLDLDLRDPDDQIGSLPDLSEDDDQDVVIDNDEETIYEPLKQTHVINVKEYEHDQNVDEDVVFVPIWTIINPSMKYILHVQVYNSDFLREKCKSLFILTIFCKVEIYLYNFLSNGFQRIFYFRFLVIL